MTRSFSKFLAVTTTTSFYQPGESSLSQLPSIVEQEEEENHLPIIIDGNTKLWGDSMESLVRAGPLDTIPEQGDDCDDDDDESLDSCSSL
mmetsp:Transcript_14218/g.23551  ORF Transcript_14218/g.23551 Transcript_14218/m.23551 type:complete len:90 (+) Transcript_14218:57-326(+)|eukprot:CAMPEP_0119008732 /NCGR_PEP_ID=MMETSP1176-20130426/3901_1 /TAXON_ID=265551 /ORGANISM="Synedropsis recta cf, Strain CCMP1620" /LENGTH=89 /DNA_ID=CAMNT_0006961123 /DNA_START=57 /DNA_END=326 /DNA_ORIENTATION=-